MRNKKTYLAGNTTLEYAIILPLVFACVFVSIIVFMILYQKALIQNIAEDAAQSLSRQWGYKPLPAEELETGVYKKSIYEKREIYWHIKLWNNKDKTKQAEAAINKMVKDAGPLISYPPNKINKKNIIHQDIDADYPATVEFKAGLPSTLTVHIRVAYTVPGAGLMKLIGLEDCLIIEGHGQAAVYDAKDMINTTDYVIQILRGTDLYENIMTKIAPIKESLDKLLKQ